MKVHILDDWFDSLRNLPGFGRLKDHEVTIWTDHCKDVDVLAERLAEAEALVLFRERTPVTDELLQRLPNLRLIGMHGPYPHVDVEACTRHGVTFCSKPSGGTPPNATAELAFGLILASTRQIPQQMASLKAGNWQTGVGQALEGRRLGLYGYGRIARQVARYARAFDMQVWWWGSEEGRARAEREDQAVALSRRQFFAESDIISVHVRLVPETRGVITAADLLAMRPWTHFVNTSRAAILEPGALKKALDAGRPGHFALDVFDEEPVGPNDPVVMHPAVTATPHIGFVTEEELSRQFTAIYDQINAYAAGDPHYVINPEVLGKA